MTEFYLSASVPVDWFKQYEEVAHKRGVSLETLVKEALAEYLDLKQPSFPLQELYQEITDLKQRVRELEASQSRFHHLSVSVSVLEHKINQLSQSGNHINPISSSNVITRPEETLTDDTEEVDEPDEVLWDFING